MDKELELTVETLIALDEPETVLPTLRRAAERRPGVRWARLAVVLGEAEMKLEQLLNAKPAGPDFRSPKPDFDPKTGRDNAPNDALPDAAKTA